MELRSDSPNDIGDAVVGPIGHVVERLYFLLNFDEGFVELVLPAQIILGEILQMRAVAFLLGQNQGNCC